MSLFQDGAEVDRADHSQKQAKNFYYIFVWTGIWGITLFIGFTIFSNWNTEPWFGISIVNPSVHRFLGDYSSVVFVLIVIVLMLAAAFTRATEILHTPGTYFDPTPIESTFIMNQLGTRYINYPGPFLGIPLAFVFYVLNWVLV